MAHDSGETVEFAVSGADSDLAAIIERLQGVRRQIQLALAELGSESAGRDGSLM